jgi:hypothetical protein
MRPRRSAHPDRKYRLDSVPGFDGLARHLYPRWRRDRFPADMRPAWWLGEQRIKKECCGVAAPPVTDRRPMSTPRRPRSAYASFSINTQRMQPHRAFLEPDPRLVPVVACLRAGDFPRRQTKSCSTYTSLGCIIIIILVLRKEGEGKAEGRTYGHARRTPCPV